MRIDACTVDAAVDRILDLSLGDLGADVHLCNAYTLALATRDRAFADLLNRSALNLPDGTPVAWVGRTLGMPLDGPTRGIDVLLSTMRRGLDVGVKHYLYGSTPETVAAMAAELRRQIPGVDIVGVQAPPFHELSDRESEEVAVRLRSSGAHIVWVGLGTPKQDRFAAEFARRVDAVFVPVGAAFDFVAGTRPHAPAWMHGTGLEWTFRLATEPRRLFGRYLWGNARFLATVARSSREAPGARLTA